MTAPPPEQSPAESVAVELERIRRTVEVGFAKTDGALALLVQRNNQTDEQLTDHGRRLDALERARWPLPSLAALIALAGLILSVWQATR